MPVLHEVAQYSEGYDRLKIGMTGLRLGDLLRESGDGLAIVPGGDRRDRGFERTGFLDALRPHVFQKLRPDFCLFDQIEKRGGLSLVDCASVPVVIVADDQHVEYIAGDIAAQVRIGASHTLYGRLATRGVQRGGHK